ncbi:MAG: hypothetical protein ACRENB_08355 [Gemmatimonadales bacterium]
MMRPALRRAMVTIALGTTVGSAPLAAQQVRTVVVVPGQMTRVVTDTMGTPFAFEVPKPVMLAALRRAYDRLKVPVTLDDSAAGRIGNMGFSMMRQIGGRQLSTYLSCGDGMTGPNADTYRVYMVLRSTVVDSGDAGTTLRTLLLAGAVNVSEGARQPMPCESTGRLEHRIREMVRQELDARQVTGR